jgi:Ca2+-binding RTX toxin-like protein
MARFSSKALAAISSEDSDIGRGAAADRNTDFSIVEHRLNFADTGLGQLRYLTLGSDPIVQGLSAQTLTSASFVLGTAPAIEPPAANAGAGGLDSLSSQSAPSAAASGPAFGDSPRGITGSYTVINTAGIAQATIDLLIGLADEALRLWGNVLAGSANISVQLTIAELANNRGNGGWGTGFTVGSSGGFSVAVGAPADELAQGLNTGGSTDIVITLDPDYIANELFLDPTPGTRNDIPVNRTDGLSVFLHEIGHALGFIGYYNEANDTFASNFKTFYDLRLQIAGGDVSFFGPNVQAVFGGAVPLTDMNYAHYGNTSAFPGTSSDPLTGLMNGVVFYRGYAYTIQDLDLAFLADTGLGTIRDDILNVALLTHMRGGPGNDTITGSALNNSLWGDEGNDLIYGGGGNDTLDGGSGINSLFGEAGNDRLLVSANGATVDGGSEIDTLVITGNVSALLTLTAIEALEFTGGASLTLTGTQASAGLALNTAVSGTGTLVINMDPGVAALTKLFVFSGSGVSVTINGTAGTDLMKLGNVAHIANGGDGIDQIKGGSAVDTINGGSGGDKINGAGGADILTGGAGNDVFKYANASDSGLGAGSDRITDFTIGQDRLNFVRIDADAVTAGDQAFSFLGTAAFAATGLGQLRYLASGADLIVQADVNGDGVADVEVILQGSGGQVLTGADFVL